MRTQITPFTSRLHNKRNLSVPISLLAIVLIGAIFRFYQIGKQPLWLDEGFSVWMGQHSIADIVKLTIDIDQHPPLYPILLNFWMGLFGFSEAAARSFSAVLGTLSIFVIYFLGKTLSGKMVGLLAALVLAFSPFHVQYGQEARAYSLLTFCGAVSLWMAARLLSDPCTRTHRIGQQLAEFIVGWKHRQNADPHLKLSWADVYRIETDLTWIGYLLFTALAVYIHNTAFFLPLSINLFVFGLMFTRRFLPEGPGLFNAPSLRNWGTAQAGVLLLWVPWMPDFYLQAKGVANDFWIPKPTLDTISTTLKTFLLAFIPDRIIWQELVWAAFVAAIVLALIKYRVRAGQFVFLALMFAVPFLGEVIISLYRPIFADRTLIWTTIPLYVLIAAGISRLRYKPYLYTASLVLVTLSWLSISNYYTYYEKERWDLAADYVSANVQEGDIIIFNAGWTQIPFDYYFKPTTHHVEEFGAPATLFERGELEPRMTREDVPGLLSIIHGRPRVWLVYSHNWWTDPDSLIPKAIDKEMRLIDIKSFPGIQVQLYRIHR